MAWYDVLTINGYKETDLPGTSAVANLDLDLLDDLKKSTYFKMLASVLKQGERISTPQKNLYERLVNGVSCNFSVEEYLQQDLSMQEIFKLIQTIKKTGLKYRLLLDAYVLAYMAGEQFSQMQEIHRYAELLDTEWQAYEELRVLSKAIVMECLDLYYTYGRKGFFARNVDVTDYINAMELKDLMLEYKWGKDRVYLAKAPFEKKWCTQEVFDLTEQPLIFRGYQSVVLENCVFIGGTNFPVHFEHCEDVRIKSCIFHNFSSRVITVEDVSAGLDIEDSIFKNCVYHCPQDTSLEKGLGILIYSEQPDTVGETFLQSCTFTYCRAVSDATKQAAGVLFNCKATVLTSLFDKCGFYAEDADGATKKVSIFEDLLTEGSSAISCRVSMPQENIDCFERNLVQNRKKKWRKGKNQKTTERDNISEAGERR